MKSISKNGIVILTRGDYFSCPLFINSGTQFSPIRYSVSEHPSTKVYLGVMEPNQPFEESLIRKTFTSESKLTEEGDIIIELLPQETEMLLPGKYYYQVKVLLDSGEVNTIIPKTLFHIVD